MNEIAKEILNGIIVAFIIWIIKQFTQKIIDCITMHSQGLNLTGCWFSEHGTYTDKDIKAIEIIYIYGNKEKILNIVWNSMLILKIVEEFFVEKE